MFLTTWPNFSQLFTPKYINGCSHPQATRSDSQLFNAAVHYRNQKLSRHNFMQQIL